MSSQLKIDTRVRSLKDYLLEFERGGFQIPSFQRDFLWTRDEIKKLFDSIKNNYPIGSIMFWRPKEIRNGFIDKAAVIGCYEVLETKQSDNVFILDGLQRLTSLFACLTNPNKYNTEKLRLNKEKREEKFELYYDLEQESFIYLRKNIKNKVYQVPVYIFVNSIDFRNYARKEFETILEEAKIELYYDRGDKLGHILNHYQIASVDIIYANIEEAVEIFRRVNERGLPISKDWIVSALTTDERGFRLASEIDELMGDLKIYNFDEIKRDVIFQCIQNSFGKIYFDFKIEELVERDDFVTTARKSIIAIKKAVKFLYEELLVLNSKLLPYNGQLIFISNFFYELDALDKEITPRQLHELKRWFWVSSYANYFTIYSLSAQRKAFEQFQAFIQDENQDPVYYDSVTKSFDVVLLPEKINMKSVRSKTMALFMINYAKNKSSALEEMDGIKLEEVGSFVMGNLFSTSKLKEFYNNPSSVIANYANAIPIIEWVESEMNENSKLGLSRALKKAGKTKDFSFLLDGTASHELFINDEMIKIMKVKEGNYLERILKEREELIWNVESKFCKSLGFETAQTLFALK